MKSKTTLIEHTQNVALVSSNMVGRILHIFQTREAAHMTFLWMTLVIPRLKYSCQSTLGFQHPTNSSENINGQYVGCFKASQIYHGSAICTTICVSQSNANEFFDSSAPVPK